MSAGVRAEVRNPSVEAGQPVQIVMSCAPRQPGDGTIPRHLDVQLVCHHHCTASKHIETTRIHAAERVVLAEDGSAFAELALPVPDDAPISYTGKLVRNRWSVKIIEDVKLRGDRELFEVKVQVLPRNGSGRYTRS